MKKLLSQHMHYLLPPAVLISARNDLRETSSSPVEFLSRQIGQKHRHTLAAYFQYVFPYLVTHAANAKEYAKCKRYLEEETDLRLKELIPSNRQKVITELMVSFNKRQSRVVMALQWLAVNDTEFSRRKRGGTKDSSLSEEELVRE